VWGYQRQGVGKRITILGAKRSEACHVYTHMHMNICTSTCAQTHEDSIIKPTKRCLKKGRGQRGNGNTVQGMSLFKVRCMHVWCCHNKAPSFY
jgi:hypothetical protein